MARLFDDLIKQTGYHIIPRTLHTALQINMNTRTVVMTAHIFVQQALA